ncbi:MAG: IS3 family transposase [Bacteroidota bacterium]
MDVSDEELSIAKQCQLIGLNRSSFYYKPRAASSLNLELMRLMDEHYLKHPYKGSRRMYVYLTKDLGYEVSRNRINRLYYQVMGLRATFPGPHTSKKRKGHKIYPYLLRDLEVSYPNQVWATDITYIPMAKGYLYLIAIIDLYSRFVLNWSLSNTMEANWCAACFLEAIQEYDKPEILNTDQGSQFTSKVFGEAVLGNQVKLSMDGKGRATDNAFIENLWKMVKYEDIYLKAYEDGISLYNGLAQYFYNWNFNRRHSAIGDKYPVEYFQQPLRANT